MKPYNPNLKNKARDLRKNMTDAERRLWSWVRRKQIMQVQFYRQKPIGDYIVDFYAPRAGLVIEVDGSQHMVGEHPGKDRKRDRALGKIGLTVLRFNNREVLTETDAVVARIAQEVRARLGKSPLTPL